MPPNFFLYNCEQFFFEKWKKNPKSQNEEIYFPTVPKVVSIDSSTLNYTVEWDDGDAQHRIHRYDELALNQSPNQSLIGIGSNVYFQQGTYIINPRSRFLDGHIFCTG